MLDEIWKVLLPSLTLVAAHYLRKLYLLTCKARGAEANESHLRQIDTVAELAVHGVDEYVHNAAKSGLTLTSNEKLDQAVMIARTIALDDLKEFTDDQVKTVLEAKASVQRAKISSAPPPMQVQYVPPATGADK